MLLCSSLPHFGLTKPLRCSDNSRSGELVLKRDAALLDNISRVGCTGADQLGHKSYLVHVKHKGQMHMVFTPLHRVSLSSQNSWLFSCDSEAKEKRYLDKEDPTEPWHT